MKTKRIFLIVFLLLILAILASCEKPRLPDNPKPPGWSSGFFGKAVQSLRAYPTWAAKPRNFFIYPEETEFGDTIRAKIVDYDYIYRFGYYFNSRENVWEMFELEDGQKVQDWYIGKSARIRIDVDEDTFEAGENYVVLYGCYDDGKGGFDCNDNKWMLETFKVIPEAENESKIIKEDIDDYIFLSLDKSKQTFAGKRLSVYSAEYIKDNDKAKVDVTDVETMASLKSFFRPWNLFKSNYEDYDGSKISSYKSEDEYYVMWLSNRTAIRIHYESEDFPADLVDAYLNKWPSTEIDFTKNQLPGGTTGTGSAGSGTGSAGGTSVPVCGDTFIRGTERCDPKGSQCIIERFDVQEIAKGDFKEIDGHTIRILEILSGSTAIVDVDQVASLIAENQIKEYDVNNEEMYVHLFNILGDTVKLAFGYDLGTCNTTCRCEGTEEEIITGPVCGDGKVEGTEECEKPGDDCIARSGLKSTCSGQCKCPEPFVGLTFCGNGRVEAPNSFGLMEMCDPPNFQVGSCTLPGGAAGWCTLTCQCITGGIGNVCGDKLIGPTEQCDPPGTVCIKDGKAGLCDNNCVCTIGSLQPQDMNDLKDMICGGNEECFGEGTSCTKDGKQGTCNASCKCVISEAAQNCGNNVINSGEECDPPNEACTYRIEGFSTPLPGMCREDCSMCDPDYVFECTTEISEDERNEVNNYYQGCVDGNCPTTCFGQPCTIEIEQQEGLNILDITIGEETKYRYAFSGNELIEKCSTGETINTHEDNQKLEYCGTTEPECWPIEKTTQINGHPAICNESCEWETEPYCGDNKVNLGEECDPPGSNCDYVSKPEIPIPIAGMCSNTCGCEQAYADCYCKQVTDENLDDPEIQQALNDLDDCLGGSCPTGVEMKIFDEDIYIIIKETSEDGALFEDRISFVESSGEMPFYPMFFCRCLKETNQGPTGGAVITMEQASKKQAIIILTAMLLIAGIMIFNILKKD